MITSLGSPVQQTNPVQTSTQVENQNTQLSSEKRSSEAVAKDNEVQPVGGETAQVFESGSNRKSGEIEFSSSSSTSNTESHAQEATQDDRTRGSVLDTEA